MNKNGLICVILLLALPLTGPGCSLAPEYKHPELPVADVWPEGEAYKNNNAGKDEKTAASIPWKAFFINDQLQNVLELALSNNRDLRAACLNIEKMQALYRIQRSEQMPGLNALASESAQRIPESLSSTGDSMIARQYNLNVGISSYELDFFGRIQSLKAKALEQFLATEQARVSTQISLVSEVAGTWLTLAADREKLKLANDTWQSQQASYDMIKQRFNVGASSELDLRQAQTRMEAARLDIARFTGKVAQDENALSLLLGCPVSKEFLPDDLKIIDSENRTIRKLTPDMPSSILLNRPDVMAAENQLKAVNANIGAARAAFFPRITLTGTYGTASDELKTLFDDAPAWSFMPQITIPIFNAGRNRANLKAAEIERDIAVANYEKTIQTAFREVADALAQSGTVDDQIEAQQALLEATDESYRLSDMRYKKGIDSYLTVLDAQRSLYSAQQAMIDARLLRLVNRVIMYRVLGGGGVSGE
ncbi:MAG: efflux transporter outer membrane subunit [Proteobacteria bacterium]|nr:efflux transporter outer membrane subunit [Pseudomonadota bacterium]